MAAATGTSEDSWTEEEAAGWFFARTYFGLLLNGTDSEGTQEAEAFVDYLYDEKAVVTRGSLQDSTSTTVTGKAKILEHMQKDFVLTGGLEDGNFSTIDCHLIPGLPEGISRYQVSISGSLSYRSTHLQRKQIQQAFVVEWLEESDDRYPFLGGHRFRIFSDILRFVNPIQAPAPGPKQPAANGAVPAEGEVQVAAASKNNKKEQKAAQPKAQAQSTSATAPATSSEQATTKPSATSSATATPPATTANKNNNPSNNNNRRDKTKASPGNTSKTSTSKTTDQQQAGGETKTSTRRSSGNGAVGNGHAPSPRKLVTPQQSATKASDEEEEAKTDVPKTDVMRTADDLSISGESSPKSSNAVEAPAPAVVIPDDDNNFPGLPKSSGVFVAKPYKGALAPEPPKKEKVDAKKDRSSRKGKGKNAGKDKEPPSGSNSKVDNNKEGGSKYNSNISPSAGSKNTGAAVAGGGASSTAVSSSGATSSSSSSRKSKGKGKKGADKEPKPATPVNSKSTTNSSLEGAAQKNSAGQHQQTKNNNKEKGATSSGGRPSSGGNNKNTSTARKRTNIWISTIDVSMADEAVKEKLEETLNKIRPGDLPAPTVTEFVRSKEDKQWASACVFTAKNQDVFPIIRRLTAETGFYVEKRKQPNTVKEAAAAPEAASK
ncbi:unnamed protein product [Amoebophrya sp. A25]|nr:unnamed protein product [Amoebophrya sp. A25]|eukprot:GSA25T00025484001.1